MSKTSDAADALMSFVDKLQPLNDVAAALKQLGSLDQAIDERTAGLATATKAHDDMLADVATAQTTLDTLRQQIATETTTAKQTADDILLGAKNNADAIVKTANDNAASIVGVANAESARILQARDTSLASTSSQLDDLKSQIAAATASLVGINSQRDTVAAQIDELKKTAQSIIS